MQYDLDDWVSYTQSRHFANMTADPTYIYFATRDGGILRYHIYQGFWDYPYTVSNGLPGNRVLRVIYDPNTSLLWAFTPGDQAVFNPASREWIRKSETPEWNYQPPEDPPVGNLKDIPRERFLDRSALKFLPTFFANGEYSFLEGGRIMDGNFQEFPIAGFFRDRLNRIWFLVDGFGVGRGDFFTQRADFYEIGLSDIAPRALAFQGDDMWIGGRDLRRKGERPGIVRWPFEEEGWRHYQARWISHLPSDEVNDILVVGDTVWFATEFGVSVYDSDRDRWKNFDLGDGLVSHQVRDLALLGAYVYVATDQGLNRIHRHTGIVERIPERRFISLPFFRLAAGRDTLWAGTLRGIFRYVDSTGRWEYVKTRAAIQDAPVTAVDVWENEVWFASPGGIFYWNARTDVWESFPQIAPEVGPPYRDIKADEEAVWVATRHGLLKYDRVRGYWRLYTTEDGLLHNNCHQLLLDGDYIWIANDAGITQFYWNNPNRSD
ncbi:MAG: hypothetical protein D6681_19585 [Calditrichaeota bacterium]|nr:MAG: hypothetical protein D6681_19585 [Calditrichota bacterium]